MTAKCLVPLVLVLLLDANAQELTELSPIDPGGEVRDFWVDRPTDNAQPLVLAHLSGGGLNAYSSKGELLLKLTGIKGSVFWGNSFLMSGRYYFFSEGLQSADFRGTNPNIMNMKSQALLRNDYDSFLGAELDSSLILVASHPMGIDVYRFPSLKPIGQLKRDEYLRHSHSLVWQGILVAAVKQNRLVGYDIGLKKDVWELNSGEFHPKFLGISMGTFPRRFLQWGINPDDQMLYASTFDGTLYRLSPRSGSVLIEKPQFRGGGNNAGLLTRFYFTDVTGTDKKELVAPSVDENIYCINPEDLSVLWSYDMDNECQMPLGFYDLTGDGRPEIFCVNDYDLNLSIIDPTSGKCLGEFSLKDPGSYKQIRIAVVDLDGDGAPELLAQSSTWKKIRIFRVPPIASSAH